MRLRHVEDGRAGPCATTSKRSKVPYRQFSQRMKFGFTFIERGQNGSVENGAFETFESFQQCCMVAEKSLNAKPLERIDVVPCEYDSDRCHPQVMSVLKTFERHPSEKPRRS